jgi:5-hydroxyisourate hydrolase
VPRLSTHVLDTTAGRPAAGIPVSLSREGAGGRLEQLGSGITDADGRVADLLGGRTLEPVPHVAEFDVAAYLAAAGWPTIYDRVPIRFTPPAGAEHLHVPLLLSPHGYTTYRGS